MFVRENILERPIVPQLFICQSDGNFIWQMQSKREKTPE
jgi:hypothetical protein